MDPRLTDPELLGTLQKTNDRLKAMAAASVARVLDGSNDRRSMEMAYAALRGEATAVEGVDALRIALCADGLGPDAIDEIEALYLNALVGA